MKHTPCHYTGRRCLCLTYFILVVGQFIRMNVNDVHVGVTFFFSDLQQLGVIFIDISIELKTVLKVMSTSVSIN